MSPVEDDTRTAALVHAFIAAVVYINVGMHVLQLWDGEGFGGGGTKERKLTTKLKNIFNTMSVYFKAERFSSRHSHIKPIHFVNPTNV